MALSAARALLARAHLPAHQGSRAFSAELLPDASPRPVSLQGALPSQVQESVFVLVEFHKALVNPFLQLG